MNFSEYALRATSKRDLLITLALTIPAKTLEELEQYKEQRGLDMLVLPRTGQRLAAGTLDVLTVAAAINDYLRVTLPGKAGFFYIYEPHTDGVTKVGTGYQIAIAEDTYLKRTPGEYMDDLETADEMMTTALKAFELGYKGSITTSRDNMARDSFFKAARDAFGGMVDRTKHLFDYLGTLEEKIEGRANADIARITRFITTPGHSWNQQGQMAKATELGYQDMRRVAALDDRSCSDCVGWDAMGWQPIGTVPPPGEGCQCLDRCRCIIEYRDR